MSKYVCVTCGREVSVASLKYVLDDGRLPVNRCINQHKCAICAGVIQPAKKEEEKEA